MRVEAVVNSLQSGVVSPVYLLYGQETYLRDELVRKFVDTLLPIEVRDFNLDLLDGKERSLSEVVALALNLPFIAEKRLVIVKDAQYFKARKKGGKSEETENNTGDEDLLRYLENPNPSTVIIFVADDIDKRKKIFNAVAKRGQTIEFVALQNRDLLEWIQKKIRPYCKRIEKEAVERLILFAGNDLQQLNSEVEKLVTYLGDNEEITVKDVELLVARKTDHTVFEVIDEVGLRNYTNAIKIIREMVFLGEQPLKILQMIGKQFRLMLQAKDLLDIGYSEKQIAEITGSHPYVIKKTIKSSRNFSKEELEGALVKTKETDYKIKSGQMEANLALELYLVG